MILFSPSVDVLAVVLSNRAADSSSLLGQCPAHTCPSMPLNNILLENAQLPMYGLVFRKHGVDDYGKLSTDSH
jgi:hypothetical protein